VPEQTHVRGGHEDAEAFARQPRRRPRQLEPEARAASCRTLCASIYRLAARQSSALWSLCRGTRVDDEGPRRARERGGDLAPIRVLTNEDSGRSGVVGQTLSFTT
jgi:hypothetical protein